MTFTHTIALLISIKKNSPGGSRVPAPVRRSYTWNEDSNYGSEIESYKNGAPESATFFLGLIKF